MILHKKIATIAFILITAFSCKKDEPVTSDADKLMGYYVGEIDQFDTLTINGNATQVRYDSWLRFYIQKSENAPFAIKYFTNTNYIVNGYIFTGSVESEGLLENISFTKENLFLINETPVNLWGKPVLLKGNGSYDETSNILTLNLSANDKGEIRQLNLKLVRQKVLD